MMLQAVIEQYVAWRRARGARFQSGASVLRLYARSVGGDIECDAVRPDQASAFLAGTGPLTRTRAVKRSALNGFYRYVLGRGLAACSPLPADEPKEPASAPPYIYSPATCTACPRPWSRAAAARCSWMRPRSVRCCCCSMEPACGTAKPGGSRWRTSICPAR